MFKGSVGYVDTIDLLSCVNVHVWRSNWCLLVHL